MNAIKHEIAFLHTARVHVKTFDMLLARYAPGTSIRHDIDESLLSDANKLGLTTAIITRTQQALTDASSTGASIVICTCSTLGGIAEAFDESLDAKIMRIDRPMADLAVTLGERVLIVAALASTLEPTQKLLQDSANNLNTSPSIDTLLVPDAWESFLREDLQNYHSLIATYLDDFNNYPGDTPNLIVLAQASMAPAADLCRRIQVPILSSPTIGITAALNALHNSAQK